MKRFASLASTVILCGCLVSAGTEAQADSTLYLVPVSDLNATYAPGSRVTFAAFADIGANVFSSVTIPAAIAYTSAEFSNTQPNKPAVMTDQTEDPTLPGSGQSFWVQAVSSYNTTQSAIRGATLYTFQDTVGHFTVLDAQGNRQAVLGGTYAVATFSFQIASTNRSGSATVYLPTPYGYSVNGNTSDGYYLHGFGPNFTLYGKNVADRDTYDPLTFPNASGKFNSLTFHVGSSAVPEPGSFAFFAAGLIGGAILLRKRKAASS